MSLEPSLPQPQAWPRIGLTLLSPSLQLQFLSWCLLLSTSPSLTCATQRTWETWALRYSMPLRGTCSDWWEPPNNSHFLPTLPHPAVLATLLICLSCLHSWGPCSRTASVPSMLAADWPCSGKTSSSVPIGNLLLSFLGPLHPGQPQSLGPLRRGRLTQCIQMPELEPWFFHLLAVWLWTSHITSLFFNNTIYKMVIITVPYSWSC